MDDVVFNAEGDNFTRTLATIDGYNILANVVLATVGFVIFIVNGVFLACACSGLYANRLPWKRFILATNLALADFLLGIALIVLNLVTIVYNVSYPDRAIPTGPLDSFIVITYGSIIVTVVIHFSLSTLQYVAIKHPLFYRISIRKRHCYAVCGASWALSCAFTGVQAYFWFHRSANRKHEITHFSTAVAIGMGIFVNLLLNSYVVYIAYQKYVPHSTLLKKVRKRIPLHSVRLSNISLVSSTAVADVEAKVASNAHKSSNWTASQLEATITHLLKELAYLLTTLPLWTLLLYEFIAGREPFEHDMAPGLIISVLFLFRSIADPLILLIREPKMFLILRKLRKIEATGNYSASSVNSGSLAVVTCGSSN